MTTSAKIEMPKVAVCMPIARSAQPGTMRNLVALLGRSPCDGFFDKCHMQVDVARNMITEAAFNSRGGDGRLYTHFMWIDDDMEWEPDAVDRLLARDLPIVGGLCFSRRHPYPPVLIHMTPRGFAFDYDYVDHADPTGLVEVDATGAAFLLVKRDVIEEIAKRDPVGPWTPIGVGEDVSFCRRARESGFRIFVDTSVKIGHVAEVVITEDTAPKLRQFQVNPWSPPRAPAIGDPVATIVIPTFNQRPDRLRAAIHSAMEQTVPVEIIVVDNGSHSCIWCGAPRSNGYLACGVPKEGSFPACLGPPAHPYLRTFRIEENSGGPWPALNLGIHEMRTPWFAWLSSDDLYYPHKIAMQLAAMKADGGARASFHGYDVMTSDWGIAQTVVIPCEWRSRFEAQSALSTGCWINGLTAMIHRDLIRDVGGFDESFRVSSDWHLWNKIAQEEFWLPITGERSILATRREYDNATMKYLKDPAMVAVWKEEDTRIRAEFRIDPEDTIGHDLAER